MKSKIVRIVIAVAFAIAFVLLTGCMSPTPKGEYGDFRRFSDKYYYPSGGSLATSH